MSTPSRPLPLAGASNFRDLGGYHTSDGRAVRWRRIFRSDHLGGLTPDDVHQLEALQLARVVDFRGRTERESHVCALPSAQVHSLPIEPTIVQDLQGLLASGCRITADDTVELMCKTYRDFVGASSARFGEFFAHLLETDAPLVFHCTAGKDRTGLAAALLLHSLGVPRPVILEDYLLTNALFRPPAAAPGAPPLEVLEVMWRVDESFLDAAFKAIDLEHGGLAAFQRDALRLGPAELDRLAALYLEPATHG